MLCIDLGRSGSLLGQGLWLRLNNLLLFTLSSYNGLVSLNGVLTTHLLGVDAGSVSPARIGGLEELITSAPTRLRTENVMKAAA